MHLNYFYNALYIKALSKVLPKKNVLFLGNVNFIKLEVVSVNII